MPKERTNIRTVVTPLIGTTNQWMEHISRKEAVSLRPSGEMLIRAVMFPGMERLRTLLFRLLALWGISGLLSTFCGCGYFTVGVRDSIRSETMLYHEFSEAFLSEDAPVHHGVYVGTIETNAMTYSRYQFTNLLAGSGTRILHILIPDDQSCRAQIAETASLGQDRTPAFLFSQYMAGKYTPAQYFQDHYPDQHSKDYTKHSMYVCVYSRPSHPQRVYSVTESSSTGELQWIKLEADAELSWVVRSHAKHRLSYLKYLYAVPLDIVTFPYQVFVWFILTH